MRDVKLAALLIVILAVTPNLGTATAQTQNQNPTTTPKPRSPEMTLPSVDGTANLPGDPMSAMREAGRARAFANERQKRIAEDTAKLLQLATELKTDVDKTTKDELSLEVIHKADEIEKLAHDVKQRMKG